LVRVQALRQVPVRTDSETSNHKEMKRNSTFLCTVLCTVLLSISGFSSVSAQCVAPKMTYINPVLVSGTDLQKNAVYKFSSVTPGVDAFITVLDLVGGATLTDIDNTTFGYAAAWQPVVRTPAVQGASQSYVSFSIEFKDSADGQKHNYDCFALSFIDVDGDNVGVREFAATRKFDSYTVSNITDLQINNENQDSGDQNPDHQGEQSGLLTATGPLLNYADIDTSAYATNINFRFRNKDMVEEVRLGNVTNDNFTVQDRYSCGYFQNIVIPYMSLLPVKYTSFDAVVVDNKSVDLNWMTSFEQNTNHFEIERSFDMSNFKTVGVVLDGFAAGGTNKNYKFNDNSTDLTGKTAIYYRLRQIDMDGKSTYSAILAVRMQTRAGLEMQVSPNPFIENLNIHYSSNEIGKAQLRIVNMTGQAVTSTQTNIGKGRNDLQINGLSKLNAGAYIAELILNGKMVAKQTIIKN
jgi:hypothetical protein